jgi:universal stress protein A
VAVIKKILSPVDLSDSGAGAIREAEQLAHDTGAELVLLHVASDPAFALPDGGYALPRIIQEYEDAIKAKLSRLTAGLRSDIVASAKTVHGTPAQAIVESAISERADLIVMGAHGRTGLSHLFLGSVAERVVRTSPVPVITVRNP